MKIGAGFDLFKIDAALLEHLQVINIENPLFPDFLEDTSWRSSPIQSSWMQDIVVDGAFIDLNPGTPERSVREITRIKVNDSIEFAKMANAKEVVFLSNYLPFLNESLYDKWFFENSVAFWKDITKIHNDIKISLANTFEFNPDILLRILEKVNSGNFGIVFDIGHAIAYAKIGLYAWYKAVRPYLSTVYVHSNDRSGDKHWNLREGIFIYDPGIRKIFNELHSSGDDINIIIKSFDKTNLFEDIDVLKSLKVS